MNVFGFPGAPDLPLTGNNLGFLDQELALKWVQLNIANFGGDPEQSEYNKIIIERPTHNISTQSRSWYLSLYCVIVFIVLLNSPPCRVNPLEGSPSLE